MNQKDFNELKQGYREALAVIRGKHVSGVSADTFKVRRHSSALDPVKDAFNKYQIKDLRLRLNLSQQDFAMVLGVSLSAVKSWEQGKRTPSKSVFNLMKLLSDDSHRVGELVKPVKD